MKFKFESSRKENYKSTQDSKKEKERKLDKLQFPFGKPWTDDLIANLVAGFVNGLAALPNLHKIKFLEWRIKSAGKKLENLYAKDQAEAINLNKTYNDLLVEAAQTGDDSKVKAFETEKLGMKENETEVAA